MDKEESEYLQPIPPSEGDEEVKEEKGLNILTLNKLLIRFSILLAQSRLVKIHTNQKMK